MKNSVSSIPTERIARMLLLILAATAACTFFFACVGHQARVENRQERRADRQERPQEDPIAIGSGGSPPVTKDHSFERLTADGKV